MESRVTATETRDWEATDANRASREETSSPATKVTPTNRPHRYAPGWYADPSDPAVSRWWDGQSWGNETQSHNWKGNPNDPPSNVATSGGLPYGGQSTQSDTGNGFSIAGIILGAVAFLFVPILLGPAGLILGAVGKSRSERLAIPALIVSACGLILGMLLGLVV
jgi:hypothetical protein